MHLSRTAWRRCAAPGARQASSLRNTAVVNSRKKQEAPRLSLVGYVCARPASTLPDVCGLPVVTSSWKAIKSLDEAYTEYANLSGDPYKRTQEALDHDPSCVMAYCLRGLLAALGQSDPATVAGCLAAAETELEKRAADLGHGAGANEGNKGVGREGERERFFAATLRAWSAGRWREGALYLETWLMSVPTDLPAVKLAQEAHLMVGDSANMRDCVGRVLPFWSEATFGYGNVVGMHAFGLVENGAYALAEEKADVALAIQSTDIWAVHAMAHVYEMEARASEGCSFLTDCRDQWEDKDGPLQQHVAWHLGLFSLERGQEAAAIRVFDTLLSPRRESGKLDGALVLPPPAPFALTDACSLLWRMDLLGAETGAERWRGVAEAWLQHEQARHLSTFHDLHAVMAFAAMANGVDDDEEAELWRSRTQDLLRSMREYVRSGGVTTSQQTVAAAAETTAARAQAPPLPPPAVVQLHSFPNGPNRGSIFSSAGGFEDEGPDGEAKGSSPPDNLWVAEHIGVALCEAMVAYRGGEFEKAVSGLLPLRYHLGTIGGSRAQQDVAHLTLVDAALRLPDQAIARTLVCERRLQRPTSGRAWEAYATVMERDGKMREAFEARKISFEFGIGQGGVGAN
ncbi:unnamed protein product [Pylaiella littoralis]